MVVTEKIVTVRQVRWSQPSLSWGLVPTMGFLHDGHLSLVRCAKEQNDRVAVTIYVNPTQFAPEEDLATYPRDLGRDLELLKTEGVDLVFIPSDETMYPAGFSTKVLVEKITTQLEGASRPTHFAGVTTIVVKLFNIVQPTRAYFGQKDAQQSVVIKRLAADLDFNLDIVVCPIVREADGLAMSSRNSRLTNEQRVVAPILHRALSAAVALFESGQQDGDQLRQAMTSLIAAEPLARLDYVSVADPRTLIELARVERKALFSLAVFFDQVRLIDNMMVDLQNLGGMT